MAKYGLTCALLFAVFLQSMAAVWWASAVTQRVDHLSEIDASHMEIMGRLTTVMEKESDRLTAVTISHERLIVNVDNLYDRFKMKE